MATVIKAYHESSPKHQIDPLAISLVVILVWQINTLICQPAEGKSFRAMQDPISERQGPVMFIPRGRGLLRQLQEFSLMWIEGGSGVVGTTMNMSLKCERKR